MSELNSAQSGNDDSKGKKNIEKTDATTVLKLHKAVDRLELDEVNKLTENSQFSENTLNTCLVKAINLFKTSNEAQDIINILLRYNNILIH